MGHLARQLAVGLAAGDDARVTLFSLSVALPTVIAEGIPGEYCPGLDQGWIPEASWAHYLAGRLKALAEEVQADVIVFDGVAPYRGVTLAKKWLRDTAFVWFRRGMWRPGVNEGQLWKSELFDLIIEPGDLASDGDRGATSERTDAIRVPPVSLVEVVERLSREDAASQLGIDPSEPTILVTLGSGRLGEVSTPGETVLQAIIEIGGWQVCVATSSIAEKSVPADSGVTEIRGVFPLVRYLDAFDAVVTAAGYNAVHEYIPAGLPTLLVPNAATQTDDQVRRAEVLTGQGLALSAASDDPTGLRTAVRDLLSEDKRAELKIRIEATSREAKSGGATETARMLADLAGSYSPQPRSLGLKVRHEVDSAKESLKRWLGPQGVNAVRRLLGRPEFPVADRMRVTLDPESSSPDARKLFIGSDISVDQLFGEDPVEHLLAGASESYMAARILLIDRHYEVVE